MNKILRVVIVDDHPISRFGVQQIMSKHHELALVGQFGTGAEAIAALPELTPDVVILDLSLPDGDGVSLLKKILACTRAAVLVWTVHERRVYADRCIKAGARGFLSKQCRPEVLLDAVRALGAGGSYIEGDESGCAPSERRLSDVVATLSDRQLEVFRMVGDGLSTRDIAGRLGLSVKTIEAHKETIKARIGAAGAADLLRLALIWKQG